MRYDGRATAIQVASGWGMGGRAGEAMDIYFSHEPPLTDLSVHGIFGPEKSKVS